MPMTSTVVAVLPPTSPHHHHIVPRRVSHLVRQPSGIVHRATLQVMREILLLCTVSIAGAVVVAVVYGWATPYASGSTAHDRLGFALWMVFCTCLFGMFAVVPLIAHMLRSPTLSAVHATRLLFRQSWLGIVLHSVVGVAIVFGLLYAGIPVVQYNAHSAITTVVVTIGSMRVSTNAIAIHRRRHLTAAAAATAIHPAGRLAQPKASQPRAKPSWWRALRKSSSLMLPSAMSAIVTTQYVMLARRIPFTTSARFLLFSLGSTLLKTLLPIATKLFIAKTRIRNSRNSLFMLVAPIMHVEIQMRMAVMRAYSQSTPIYVSTAIVNVLEIVMRVATVAVDLALVNRARLRKEHDQLAAVDASMSTFPEDGPGREIALAARVEEIESDFRKWKREHLRNCSTEILAEMAAEYCSIGIVALYMVVLHDNRSIDLPASSAHSVVEEVGRQLIAWATQIAFEIVTDVVAIVFEMRAGIPLLDTLQHDKERFLRWVIPVVVIHACGLCLSSLVVF